VNNTLQRIVGSTFAYYSKLIQNTIRVQIHGWEPIEALIQRGGPVVGVGLHTHTRVAATVARHLPKPATKQICGIIAGDHRQVLLETFNHKLGFLTYAINMQEDSFRAARELLQVLQDLKSNRIAYIYLAVDGPDGPVNVPKPGAAFIAQRLGATIVPVTFASPRAIILRSRWDQMAIPVPFSDVYVYFGEPSLITKEMNRDEILNKISHSLEIATSRVNSIAAG
jgi:lysophospholipid acyltransferase (LPLAT)-like uncharacterized protein